jgi:hypothetical protein
MAAGHPGWPVGLVIPKGPDSRALLEAAGRISVPVEFLLQWDDEMVPRRGITTSVSPSPWSSGLSAPTGSRQAAMSTTSKTTVRVKTKISIKYLH